MTSSVTETLDTLADKIARYCGAILLVTKEGNSESKEFQWRGGEILSPLHARNELFQRFSKTPWGDCRCLISDLGESHSDNEHTQEVARLLRETLSELHGWAKEGSRRRYLLIIEMKDPDRDAPISYRFAKLFGKGHFTGPQDRKDLWSKLD